MGKTFSDEELLSAILSTKSYAEAAKVLGCSKNTICRRLKDEGLYSRLLSIRKDVLSTINQFLISKGIEAVNVVYDVMNNAESDSTRLSAANSFLSFMNRTIENENILDEIQQMKIQEKLRKVKSDE